ncbi:heme lyase CcmF/NrfE family subunit [Algimonas porphyrae]|uniref:C-type cytochrome biogenesis protein CcmF n=1 Tax=Algimonas porphyrae TaxID=1128113 RepID=A0ABQ5UWX6_9PROT|nr:heme lyase CcmF/NrfE family subunit [Algimonas porphyrae]GLQ19711.1 c-type cytochrome biogenesis protein CcmF [Algimonas porphyrae]
MIAEVGHIALILAFVVAILQGTIPLIGAHFKHGRAMALAERAALAQAWLLIASFSLLTIVFLRSDFSVLLAANHSHTMKPLLYKISGVWANHEGSMLLWVVILGIFGAMVPLFGRALPLSLKARALAVQGLLGAGFIGFLLFTSNPFERLSPVPLDGRGLNPLLQDPGLAFHPPLLYVGYVGFSLAFSFAVAALIEGRVDAVWARWLRPWVLLAWSFLTLGITVGSVWAYYELGWGGWWMWDPVENVSFMPWLAGTALLHSILSLQHRHSLANWTVLLAISTFSLSMIGTFVVRSGVLVSVHAFAVDPARGVVILTLLLIYTGAALALYAMRSNTLQRSANLHLVSREGGLVVNNILLVVATATVFLGTFYPLFVEATSGDKISVGAPYFDAVFAPMMIVLILVMAIAPMLKWREDRLPRYRSLMIKAAIIAGVVTVLTFWLGRSVLGALSFGVAGWLIAGTVAALHRRTGFKGARLRAQPAGTWGFVIAHLGVAVFTIGVTAMSIGAQDDIARMQAGDSLDVAGYTFTLQSKETGARDNFQYLEGTVDVTRAGREVATLTTQRRYYPVREMFTSEAGFKLSPGAMLFAAIGEGGTEGGVIIRAYYQPGVLWIWIGALMMALAGFVSLADQRLRVPKQAKPAIASADAVPAE